MTIMSIPIVVSMADVGGAASPADIERSKRELAPCRIIDCEETPQLALGGKNFCGRHARLIVHALPEDKLMVATVTGWATQPLSLYDCPSNLPRAEIEDSIPTFS